MKKALLALVLCVSCGVGIFEEDCTPVMEYTPLTMCGDGTPTRWKSFPLQLVVEQPVDFDLVRWTRAGVARWEEDTSNLPLFTFGSCAECPKVYIGEANEQYSAALRAEGGQTTPNAVAVGTASSYEDCSYTEGRIFTLRGEIDFREVGDNEKASIMQHELGHILGLNHDPDGTASLMSGTSRGSECRAAYGHVLWVWEQWQMTQPHDDC